jgi:hypothetical protein
MDEKIRNVMRLEEKQETKQQEKLSKISKTTHIISRKKTKQTKTPIQKFAQWESKKS